MKLLHVCTAAVASLALSGCALLADASLMEEAGLGTVRLGALESMTGPGAVADVSVGEIAISDDMTVAADGIKVAPEMQGELTKNLQSWTSDGT